MPDIIKVEDQELVLKNSISELQNASAILKEHQTRSRKGVAIAQNINSEWAKVSSLPTLKEKVEAGAPLDERSMNFIIKANATTKELNAARAPITQLMDLIKTMYTQEENAISPATGPEVKKIQASRNAHAANVKAYQQQLEKEREEKRLKEAEAQRIKDETFRNISKTMNDALTARKMKMLNSFNAITLADYGQKAVNLRHAKTEYDRTEYELARTKLPEIPHFRHDAKEYADLVTGVGYDIDAFVASYETQIAEYKQSLVDRLPSKKEELDEAERIRLENERKENERLKKLEEEKDAKAKQKLLDDAAEEKRKEQARLDRLEQEKKDREKEESDKLARENDTAHKATEETVSLRTASAGAQSLFDQSVSSHSFATSAPKGREGWAIDILAPGAWVELFSFWFQREGFRLSIDEISRKTFDQIKKFAEKEAKDSADGKKKGTKIESKFLEYKETFAATNRASSK